MGEPWVPTRASARSWTRGRVHGIGHLHVADASIMPAIPSANTNLPTIMIAERIASWITAERNQP
jgi:choline dehydrogenase-like flavoprotein